MCTGDQEKVIHLNEIIRGLKQIVKSARETLTLLRFVANFAGALVFSQGNFLEQRVSASGQPGSLLGHLCVTRASDIEPCLEPVL